jgi:nucleotide-binding universal stress UspA family protein
VLWGEPGPALTQASADLDLLVMGSRTQGRVRRTLFGSVSNELLHHSHCPLVVLPRGVHAPVDTAAV